jgi:hypothetical protein
MAPRILSSTLSLDSLWHEATYTRARCLGDANAVDLAPHIAPFVAEIEETKQGQQKMWGAEIDAQALCDGLNGQMDDLVVDFANACFFTIKDRKSPRLERYFSQPPYSIVRLALRAEVEVVRAWPRSLETEPEELLRAYAPKFTALVSKADAALVTLTQAHSDRLDHRVRVISPLVERLNKARLNLYGLLASRTGERNLGRYWPDGFFKVSQRRTADEAADPVAPAEPVE